MKLLCAPLVVLLFLIGSLSVASAQSEILIDGFLDEAGPLSTSGTTTAQGTVYFQDFDPEQDFPVQRTLTVAAGGEYGMFVLVEYNSLIINGGPDGGSTGNATFTAEYLGFDFDFSGNDYFQFVTNEVSGSAVMAVELFSGITSATVLGLVELTPSNGATFSLNLTELTNYSPTFMSELNGITVMIYHDTQFSIQGQAFQFSSIPEPSTYALLALSGVGLCAYRFRGRRRS